MKIQIWWVGILMLLVGQKVLAHPGHGSEITFWSGMVHPLHGLDHLSMMLAVGLCAATQVRFLRWGLPVMFLGAMLAGIMVAGFSFSFPHKEILLSVSVLLMAGLLVMGQVLPTFIQLGLVTAMGAVHGYAHGVELQQHLMAMAGVMLMTGILHAVGLGTGMLRTEIVRLLQQAMAVFMAMLGGIALIGV